MRLNNATLSSLIFKEFFPGGSPEHNELEKHCLVTQTLPLSSTFPCAVPLKHWQYCRYETLTLNNSTPSGQILKQSVSGGKPEPNLPEKHNLATKTLPLRFAIPYAGPHEVLGILKLRDFDA